MYQKQKWTYGVYEWNWIREWPTQKKFEGWKKDFLSLSEVKDYEVWVSGGFLQEWKSPDIDIQLWDGPKDFKVIEKLLYEGTNLGITKYNMFVDMSYNWIKEDKKYYGFTNDPNFKFHNLKPKKRNIMQMGTELYQDTGRGNYKTWERKGIPLREGLYYTSYIAPKPKQTNRIYTQRPIKLQ